MNSPTGQEFALENINRRETSIIVRKTGMDTLVQRNGGGTPVIVEITDAVKAQLLELWSPSQSGFLTVIAQGSGGGGGGGDLNAQHHSFQNIQAGSFTPDKRHFSEATDEPAKRRGRPPKAS